MVLVRVLLKCGAVLLALAIGVLALACLASRLSGPSTEEVAALALLDAPVEPGARALEAFAALYTLNHQVPKSAQVQVVAGDAVLASLRSVTPVGSGASSESLLSDWPSLLEEEQAQPIHCLRNEPCLTKVRSQPESYQAWVSRHAPVLQRVVELGGYEEFASPMPPSFITPLPSVQALLSGSTAHALEFVQGRVEPALRGVCTRLAGHRVLMQPRLGGSLMLAMVGAAAVDVDASLLAEMLAELPLEFALPAECGALVGSVSLDQGYCQALLHEGQMLVGELRRMPAHTLLERSDVQNPPRVMMRLLYDPERTAARVAPTYVGGCSDQVRAAFHADVPIEPWETPKFRRGLSCVSNAVGCILADIPAPAYPPYGRRMQDAQARLGVISVVLAQRSAGVSGQPEALSALRSDQGIVGRPLLVSSTGDSVGIALHEPRDDEPVRGQWWIPLPASRVQSAAAAAP